MALGVTPSQTVGPFFGFALPFVGGPDLVAEDHPDAILITGQVLDGEGDVVPDALVEIWQANAAGRYDHPDDPRADLPLEEGFRGFGRAPTDDDGRFRFTTIKPGPVPGVNATSTQAPHILFAVLARGLLQRLATRMYFPDEEAANAADPVLSALSPEQRATLVAHDEGGGVLRFDIRLQGAGETAFFAV
jgi:protocatechuate 3,4-dioxygenase alpha subunit